MFCHGLYMVFYLQSNFKTHNRLLSKVRMRLNSCEVSMLIHYMYLLVALHVLLLMSWCVCSEKMIFELWSFKLCFEFWFTSSLNNLSYVFKRLSVINCVEIFSWTEGRESNSSIDQNNPYDFSLMDTTKSIECHSLCSMLSW